MMSDAEFPNAHTTTTTVTTTNTNVQTNIRFDSTYIKTIPGILKCAQIVLNILTFLTVYCSAYSSVGSFSFISFVGTFGMWCTGILLGCYLFHVVEKFYYIPWLKFEFIYCGIWTLFFMIGSTLCVSNMGTAASFGAVGFFGYLNMIGYGYDCFLKFKGIQNNEIAQGERQTSKTVNETASPAY